jgi:phosphate/sulfate permease
VSLTVLAVITVAVVVIFDYTNGFHDASNIIATVIASRAMTPIQAVVVVAVFEFLGPVAPRWRTRSASSSTCLRWSRPGRSR